METDKSQATGDQNHDAAPSTGISTSSLAFLSFVPCRKRPSIRIIHMFAQLRKSATVTESLKSMIQAPILPLEVIKLLRIGTKEFSLWFSRSGLATGLP